MSAFVSAIPRTLRTHQHLIYTVHSCRHAHAAILARRTCAAPFPVAKLNARVSNLPPRRDQVAFRWSPSAAKPNWITYYTRRPCRRPPQAPLWRCSRERLTNRILQPPRFSYPRKETERSQVSVRTRVSSYKRPRARPRRLGEARERR